jgi:hypothetical protein
MTFTPAFFANAKSASISLVSGTRDARVVDGVGADAQALDPQRAVHADEVLVAGVEVVLPLRRVDGAGGRGRGGGMARHRRSIRRPGSRMRIS